MCVCEKRCPLGFYGGPTSQTPTAQADSIDSTTTPSSHSTGSMVLNYVGGTVSFSKLLTPASPMWDSRTRSLDHYTQMSLEMEMPKVPLSFKSLDLTTF